MKILFSSYLFNPSVGGIESVSKILVEKFAATGNEVHIITQTTQVRAIDPNRPRGAQDMRVAGGSGEPPLPNFRLTRRPSIANLFSLLRWSYLFFQNNISLRSLIPALLLRRSTLVVHQTWLRNTGGGIGWNNRLKQALLRFVTNIAISKAVADGISGHSFVIGNPYDDTVFHLIPNVARDRELVFVGRLVSDNGVDLLLQALRLLQSEGLSPDLTIVGSGPEEENLRNLTRELGLHRQITFAGQKSGAALAEILNRHRILVVPSKWAEPFGIVSLEGIACGCVVVGSENGGLKEAIGPCGLTFENGNVHALAAQLKRLLNDRNLQASLRQHTAEHLAKFQSDAIAAAYLRVMRKMIA